MEKIHLTSQSTDIKSIFLFGEEAALRDFSVLRMVAEKEEEFTAELILSEIALIEGKALKEGTFWLFSSTGPEPDTLVARHLRGSKNSVWLGQTNFSADIHESNYALDGQIWWYGLRKVNMHQLNHYSWSLFGLSTQLVLVANNEFDLATISKNIFMSILNDKKAAGQTRKCIPAVLEALPSKSRIRLINAYGSDDFGGFFLNIFLPKP